jgi:hypothetical protein
MVWRTEQRCMSYLSKIILAMSLVLTGCSTPVPVHRNFPVMPTELKEKCSELHQIKSEAKLSDVTKTVAENYSLYHQCKNKHSNIVDWYEKQKQIFENIK